MSDGIGPLFNDTRAALEFAFNVEGRMPKPWLSTMATEKALKKLSAAKRKRLLKMGEAGELLLWLYEVESTAKSRRVTGPVWRGLDRSAQAAYIQQALERWMPREQVMLLEARCVAPDTPCSCRAPCCKGSRPTPRWDVATRYLFEWLRAEAELSKVPGRRGFSVNPGLRRALVRLYFLPESATLVELALEAKASTMTVAKHRAMIGDALAALEVEAWANVQPLFDQLGITGAIG